MKLSLLSLKSVQSRREARRLVTPNQQRATLSGVILASTRRAMAILPTCFVINRSFNQLNHALSAVQLTKMAFGSDSFISVNRPSVRRSLIRYCCVFTTICLSVAGVNAVDNDLAVMVLDFELKDLTIYEDNHKEVERTAKVKPLLEQALNDLGGIEIVAFDLLEQQQADIGKGYLYNHFDLVAEMGRSNKARWVVLGRVHKPSYLFSYLKVKLIDAQTERMVADLTVEMKGQQDKFINKAIHRLAVQIKEALNQSRHGF